LNLYSDGDLIVPGKDITGAENLRFEVKDHYQVATSRKTFEALYRFFRERDPKKERTMYEAGEPILIGGKTVSLGTNNPQKNAEIQVYELDSNTGFRMDDRPLKKIVSDENGNWGPFKGKAGVHYEFLLIPEGNHQRKIHYYRTPFYSDNPFVYLRALPPSGSMAGMLLAGLPKDDNQSIAAIFTANQAVIHGRDQLIIDDIELSTSAFAPASANHIAWFLYDANFNKATDAEAIPAFQMAPFLTGVDVFFPTQNPQTITATFNGEKLNFRNWKSGSDGIVVLVFD
nr:hypothetical protein [Saprospiraceae bacterium]